MSGPVYRTREFTSPPEEGTRRAVVAGNAQNGELLSALVAQVEAMQARLEAGDAARRRLEWRAWVTFGATLIAAVAAVVALFLAA